MSIRTVTHPSTPCSRP